MYSPARLVRFATVALAALALTGCVPVRVHSYVERGTDFSRYRTYNWGPPDSWTTGDPRLDNNPFFQERVRAEVDRQLARRGFEKAAPLDNTRPSPSLSRQLHPADRHQGYRRKGRLL